MRDVTQLDHVVDQHLTAAAVMVEISEPLPAAMLASEAERELSAKEFDLSLVALITRQTAAAGTV